MVPLTFYSNDQLAMFERIELLMHNPKPCSKEKVEGLTNDIARIFFKETGKNIDQTKRPFCSWFLKKVNRKSINPSQIIIKDLFSSMIGTKVLTPQEDDFIERVLVPHARAFALNRVPHEPTIDREEEAINQWYKGLINSLIINEEVRSNLQEFVKIVKEPILLKDSIEDHEKIQKLEGFKKKLLSFKITLDNTLFTDSLTPDILDCLIVKISEISVEDQKIVIKIGESDFENIKELLNKSVSLFSCHYELYNDIGLFDMFKCEIIGGLELLKSQILLSED